MSASEEADMKDQERFYDGFITRGRYVNVFTYVLIYKQ